MKTKLRYAILLGLSAFSVMAFQVYAGYTTATIPTYDNRFVSYDFFASSTPGGTPTNFATTTTATSTNMSQWTDVAGRIDNGYFVVAGAERVTFSFERYSSQEGNAGSSVFNVEVSQDGTNWTRYNKLISNVINTNGQNLTRAEQFTISAATSTVIASMSPEDAVYAVRCIVTETTDGTHKCRASAKY